MSINFEDIELKAFRDGFAMVKYIWNWELEIVSNEDLLAWIKKTPKREHLKKLEGIIRKNNLQSNLSKDDN